MENKTIIIAILLAVGVFCGSFFLKKVNNNNIKFSMYGILSCFFIIYFFVTKFYPSLLFAIIAASPIFTKIFQEKAKEN